MEVIDIGRLSMLTTRIINIDLQNGQLPTPSPTGNILSIKYFKFGFGKLIYNSEILDKTFWQE
ncbi:hypothetical protein [uncultured Muribaculum sp.]|uniref:hypothetical protein n=1 Tax=uncultured Muribaculum sp. TaxID=1918613 RepID=UPI00261AEDB2|nr:hypothetical protein [uncultured Muribaculum sp.]